MIVLGVNTQTLEAVYMCFNTGVDVDSSAGVQRSQALGSATGPCAY